jgi:hypothetical protein
MEFNPTFKRVLIIAAKHAVNAILTNGALMIMLHGAFNTSTTIGWWNIGKATLSVVLAREAVVWGPVILNWTQTNNDLPPKEE